MSGLVRWHAGTKHLHFVVWLEAHLDFLTHTTASGNLHGVPPTHASGQPGFRSYSPDLPAAVDPKLGLRSASIRPSATRSTKAS